MYYDGRMEKITDQELQDLQRQFPSALSYLTSIFIITREYGKVGNARLAGRLKVSKPAANQAIGRLKKLGLTEQDLYGSITLTEDGNRYASAVLRRHYLIEHLLISKLEYPWEKSDEEAQRLESTLSEDFTDFLFQYFHQPRTCPHGNPFPGAEGEEELVKAPRVIDAPLDSELKLIRITEEGESREGLLPFCHTHNLYPGRKLTVTGRTGGGLTAQTGDKEVEIPDEISAFLCYKLL